MSAVTWKWWPLNMNVKQCSGQQQTALYIMGQKRNAILFWTITPAFLERFLLLFVPVETEVNTPHLTCIMAWWRHHCVTSPIATLRLQKCYLQCETTVSDWFRECIRLKRLFTTFTESDPMFMFSNRCREILFSVFFYILTGFWSKFYLYNSVHLILRSKLHEVKLWCAVWCSCDLIMPLSK